MPTLASRLLAALAFTAVAGLAACDNPAARMQAPPDAGARSSATTPVQPTLDAEIRSLVTTGFPKGQATAILAKWDQVVRTTGTEPKTTLKGRTVPGSQGRSKLVLTVSYMQLQTNTATPPAGETPAHYVARIALDMSLYVYGGASTPVPTVAPTADVAFDIVQPTNTDTIVTPAQHAAVVFPSNSVSEPTVVVVTPDSVYYPDNCTGPLVTHLCQYPRFYHFNVFPDVRLNAPAMVQVCHVDAGSVRAPLANHDRFRFAHDKPADPADYVPNGQIVDGIEILPLVSMGVTQCPENGGTTYNTASAYIPGSGVQGMLGYLGHSVLRGVTSVAKALFVPKDAYAIDQGGGGLTLSFSNFEVVDPQSIADLAESTGPTTAFSLQSTSTTPGGTISTNAWTITNAGSGTSDAFTSDLIVATDSLLTSPVGTPQSLGGASSLIPRAAFGYAAQTVTMPSTPGTYYVGTRIKPAGADSAASDNLVSVAVTVTAPLSGPADVAVANTSSFLVTPSTIVQGASYGVSSYTFTNVGGTTSLNFVPRLGLATNAALNTNLQWLQSGTSMSLAPGQSYTAPASTLTMSPCLDPGTYYIGPRVDQVSGPDANAANDAFGYPVTVLQAAPATGQSVSSASWGASGQSPTIAFKTDVQPHCATLSYNYQNYPLDYETFQFTTTAAASGTYSFNIHYSGLHDWFQAYAGLDVFVDSPTGEQVITVIPWTSVWDFFDFGIKSVTVQLSAGYPWGVRVHGQNYDGTRTLQGTVQIMDP